MQFDSQRPGDAIATPFCRIYDREDALFEGFGGRSWNRVNSLSNQADANPTGVVLKDRHDVGAHLEIARDDVAGRRKWITSISSVLTRLCSKIRHKREIRRLGAAWEMIDDRTMRDIGVSRYEIDQAGDLRPGADGYRTVVAQICAEARREIPAPWRPRS
jgi:uncharacterized protein YjiS (DUF1127 family)